MNTSDIVVKKSPLTLSDDNRSSSQCRFKASLSHVPTKHIKLLSTGKTITKDSSFDSSVSVAQVFPHLDIC